MAIKQVTTVTIDGVTIGLSDTIGALITNGDFTVENLTPYMIVGQVNKLCPKYGSFTGAERSYSGSAGSLPPQFPNVNTGSAGGVTVEFAQDDNLSLSHDMYGRNILIYGSLGTPQIYSITDGMTSSTLRVVTSIDFKKIYYDVDMSGESISFTRPEAKTITNYQSGSDGRIRTTDNDVDTNISVFAVVDDGNNESWYCLIDDLFPQSNSYAVRWLQSTPQYMSGAYQSTYTTLNDGWNNFTVDKTLWRWSEPAGYLIYGGDGGNWGESFVGYIDNGNNFYAYLNYTPYGGFMQCVADGLEYALNQLANAGLKFKYNNTFYKPIAEGGIVTGYTDDMSEKSDWDDIVDVTGNVVPVTPTPGPGPGPSEDDSDWDDIPINGAGIGGGSAFCRFYYCTEAELANLRTWTMGLSQSGDHIPGGFDPKSNIIGLTVFPFTVNGNGPTTIKFTTNGGMDPVTQQEIPRSLDSGVSCEGGAGATVSLLNASIDVPATMKDRGEPWLDYESYIELYIPMCGIYQVDPQVCIGRTIHVEIFLDPVSGTVMGLAWVPKDGGKCIIAQGSGTPGVQIPVAVGNYGLAQAARVQNTLGVFGNTASSAISNTLVSNAFSNRAGERGLNGVRKISQNSTAGSRIAAFNRSGGAGNIASSAIGFAGLLSSAQHWVSARQIANSPGTSASGGFSGSMAEWCGVFKPYVKVVRPKFRKPTNYKHTCGEPEVTARTLNSVGYAVCINPDVSGLTNATEAERAAVYQYLSTGVYYK